MRSTCKAFLSLLLVLALVLGLAAPSFAAYFKAEEADKPHYVEIFNTAVNRLKTDRPGRTVRYRNYVPEGGISKGESASDDPTVSAYYEELDEEVSKYLIPVLEGMFNNRSSLTKSFVKTLLGTETAVHTDEVRLSRDALRNNIVPLYGKETVSELEPADDYELVLEEEEGEAFPRQMALSFDVLPLEQKEGSSLSKVFSLPTGVIDPVLISGGVTSLTSRLEDAEIRNFKFKNAKAVLRLRENGDPYYYGTQIDYDFAISFYDCMNLISAVLGYNFYTAVINTVKLVMENIGREDLELSPEDVMKDQQVFITYRCIVEITDIDFSKRVFGDVDDDGAVTAADARIALRHAVELEAIESSADRICADVDFDGAITAADARIILRTAVGLEEPFTEVPEGKEIKIERTEEVEPDDPGELDPDTEREQFRGIFSGLNDGVQLPQIAEQVLAIVNSFMDTAGEGRTLITDLIAAIKAAVDEKDNETKPKP